MKFALFFVAAAGLWAQGAPTPQALTEAQKQAIQQKLQALNSDAKAETDKLSAKANAIAKDIDRNLLAANPDAELDRKLSAQFSAAVVEIVSAAVDRKLATVREIVKLLTPEQRTVLLAEVQKPEANPDLAELIGKVFK